MSKALDKDETISNFNSPLEWASDQFKFVLNNELFTRNHIQSHKSVPETKIENQQTTINKQDVNVDDHFESASQMSKSYHRSCKLPHSTAMFMADGRTCDDWFFVFENALDTSGIPDDMILSLLSNLVKDTALQLLKTYMRDNGSDSNRGDFKQILRNTFHSVDLDYRNRVKLTNLKQRSDSIVHTFSRHPGSSHNPTNHTPHNSGSSDVSLSKRKVRGMQSIQTNNSHQLLRVHGTVANVTYLLCTLDLASSISMMSESTAHHYKFPIHPSDIQIKYANNAAHLLLV
jgi:hypothetical protein